MRKFLSLAIFASVLLGSQLLLADQIVLSNGDRITGTITKSDGENLIIKTESAGEITVKWSAIQEVNSSQNLHVGLKDGQTAAGAVKTADGKIEVESAGKPAVNVSKETVAYIRNDAEEAAYQKTLHPRLTEGWAGGAGVSFALTRGNSETKNLALAFTADRKTLTDHLGLYTNAVYATNDAAGAIPGTTANAVQGGARFDRDLSKRLFAFVGADFQTDALQSLDLRSVFGGGLGYHAIKNDRTTLDFLGGVNYTRESYSDLKRNLIALTLGEEFFHKFGSSTVLTQKLYAYPDINEAGEYRAVFNFGTITKINKWLGWQNAFGDIYVTNPPLGKRQNDILLTTGLNVSFGGH